MTEQTTTKTIEQLKIEAAAASAALALAQEEAARVEREKKEAEARALREAAAAQERAKRDAVVANVRAALEARGVAFVDTDDNWHALIVVPREIYLNVEKQYEAVSSWRSRETGRYLVTLDGCGDRTRRFPPTKSGYSYDKIAEAIKSALRGLALEAERKVAEAKRRAAAADVAQRVRVATGCDEQLVAGAFSTSANDGRRWHTYTHTAQPGRCFVRVGTLELDADLAEELARVVLAVKAKAAQRGRKES